MKPSPASHSPAECRLYNFLLLFLFRNYPGRAPCWLGDCPRCWAWSLLGSALVSQTHRHMVSCPIPALQRTLSPSPLCTSALAVSLTISPQLVQTPLALLGPSATPPGSLPQRPLLVLVSSLLVRASCMPGPVPGSGTDVAASKTETDPVVWSWGLYPLCPVHPACFVRPLGGESEVWCSLYMVWSWASPFPSLASIVSIAAEGRGSMSCPGTGRRDGKDRPHAPCRLQYKASL